LELLAPVVGIGTEPTVGATGVGAVVVVVVVVVVVAVTVAVAVEFGPMVRFLVTISNSIEDL